MIHINDSEKFAGFLASAGIRVTDSYHNTIELVNIKTHEKIVLVAESDYSVALGIPGIYVSHHAD